LPCTFFIDLRFGNDRRWQLDEIVGGHPQLPVDGVDLSCKLGEGVGRTFPDGSQRITIDLAVERLLSPRPPLAPGLGDAGGE
jgi:hypothetical protein